MGRLAKNWFRIDYDATTWFISDAGGLVAVGAGPPIGDELDMLCEAVRDVVSADQRPAERERGTE